MSRRVDYAHIRENELYGLDRVEYVKKLNANEYKGGNLMFDFQKALILLIFYHYCGTPENVISGNNGKSV